MENENPYRSAGQGEFGEAIQPSSSKDASQETVASRGLFDTYQLNILDRMIELTRDQNPDWIYVYSDSETPIPDDYPMDTILDIAGGGGAPPPVAHDILSVTHTDSTANAVLRGAIITGQGVAPTWARLNAGAVGTVLTMGAAEPAWAASAAGDSVSVNGVACTDVDLDDATPAAPANSLNVKWQKDLLAPNNVSAYLGYGAGLSVAGGVLVSTITQYTDEMAEDAVGGTLTATTTITPTYNDGLNQMTWDVNTNSIAFAQMQQIATDSLLGRDTVGVGNVENITLGAGLAMSGAGALTCTITQYTNHNILSASHPDATAAGAVRGDIITAQGVGALWTRLAAGAAGTVLTMGASEPAWATHALIPSGIICLWFGLIAAIPAGWTLCDGTAGTPDLRDYFVKGASAGNEAVGGGGAATHTHAAHVFTQANAHSNHVFTQPNAHSTLTHTTAADSTTSGGTAKVVATTHTISAHAGGAVDAHSAHAGSGVDGHDTPNSEPPYLYTLFIMKT